LHTIAKYIGVDGGSFAHDARFVYSVFMTFHFFDDEDTYVAKPAPRKGARVHRALTDGSALCAPQVYDEHRMNLATTTDDALVTCKRCRAALGR
jgi:hypothetical protein